MGSEVEQLNTVSVQVYAQISLIERIYIDFTVVEAAATAVESSSEPNLKLNIALVRLNSAATL